MDVEGLASNGQFPIDNLKSLKELWVLNNLILIELVKRFAHRMSTQATFEKFATSLAAASAYRTFFFLKHSIHFAVSVSLFFSRAALNLAEYWTIFHLTARRFISHIFRCIPARNERRRTKVPFFLVLFFFFRLLYYNTNGEGEFVVRQMFVLMNFQADAFFLFRCFWL